MNHDEEEFFNQGIEHFENYEHEEALVCFIKAYETNHEREDILKLIYDCYVTPNDDEFRKNYRKCENLLKIEYEECAIDFIPVSDTKYYLYNRNTSSFAGHIDLKELEGGINDRSKQSKSIYSLLVEGCGDFRKFLNVFCQKQWNETYVILGEYGSFFSSFFKLPKIWELLESKVVYFSELQEMKEYFEEHTERYLPKSIYSGNPLCQSVVTELHKERVKKQLKKDNTILSICIPSFNRGEVALNTVKSLLEMIFDNEIEIVVSDNGSSIEKEAYNEIATMEDTRIVYHRFDENKGFGKNLLKTIELASGKYVVLLSDEDTLELSVLPEYLEFLYNCNNTGVIFSDIERSGCIERGYESMDKILEHTYMSGIAFNKKACEADNIIETLGDKLAEYYVNVYMHIAVGLYLERKREVCYFQGMIWKKGEEKECQEKKDGIPNYIWLENRKREFVSLMRLCNDIYSKQEMTQVIHVGYQQIIGKLELGYEVYFEQFHEKYQWWDVCMQFNRCCQDIIYEYSACIENVKYLQELIDEFTVFKLANSNIYDLYDLVEGAIMVALANSVVAWYNKTRAGLQELDVKKIQDDILDTSIEKINEIKKSL